VQGRVGVGLRVPSNQDGGRFCGRIRPPSAFLAWETFEWEVTKLAEVSRVSCIVATVPRADCAARMQYLRV